MFYIDKERHSQSYIDLRKIAFQTKSGSGRHVAHDDKLNHICFTDGYYKYEVDCTVENQLTFTNYCSGISFILSLDVGTIFFSNAMINDADILKF